MASLKFLVCRSLSQDGLGPQFTNTIAETARFRGDRMAEAGRDTECCLNEHLALGDLRRATA